MHSLWVGHEKPSVLQGRQVNILFSQKVREATCVILFSFLLIHVVRYILSNLRCTISSVSECTNSSAFCCGWFV